MTIAVAFFKSFWVKRALIRSMHIIEGNTDQSQRAIYIIKRNWQEDFIFNDFVLSSRISMVIGVLLSWSIVWLMNMKSDSTE